jgi:hypothetical protein
MPEISLHSVCHQGKIIGVRSILALVIFFFRLPALDHPDSSAALQESRTEPRPCDVNLLPAQVQNRIKADFSSLKLQGSENLVSEHGRVGQAKKHRDVRELR